MSSTFSILSNWFNASGIIHGVASAQQRMNNQQFVQQGEALQQQQLQQGLAQQQQGAGGFPGAQPGAFPGIA